MKMSEFLCGRLPLVALVTLGMAVRADDANPPLTGNGPNPCAPTDCGCNESPSGAAESGGGCASCSAAAPGSANAGVASLDFSVYLGGARVPGNWTGGSLFLAEEAPSSALSTPAALKYTHDLKIELMKKVRSAKGSFWVPGNTPVIPMDVNGVRVNVVEAYRYDLTTRNAKKISYDHKPWTNLFYPGGKFHGASTVLSVLDSSGDPAKVVFTADRVQTVQGDIIRVDYLDDHGQGDLFTRNGNVFEWAGSSGPGMPARSVQSQGIGVKRDGNGALRQVLTPRCLADILVSNKFSYAINIYPSDRVGGQSNGLYVAEGAPSVVWKVENPDTTNAVNRLKITQTSGGNSREFLYVYTAAGEQWSLLHPGGRKNELAYTVRDGDGDRVAEVFETRDAQDAARVRKSKTECWRKFPWGDAITNTAIATEGGVLNTARSYYEDVPEDDPKYGMLKQTVQPSGNWARYGYDQNRRKTEVLRPFMDSASGQGDAAQEKTVYGYGESPETEYRPSTVTTYALGIPVKKTFTVRTVENKTLTETSEDAGSGASAYGDAGNRRTTTAYYPGDGELVSAGKKHYRITPDGRRTTWGYLAGTFTPAADPSLSVFTPGAGAACQVVETEGTSESPDGVAYKTTRKADTFDRIGNKVLTEKFVYTGAGYERTGWVSRRYDSMGHLTSETTSAGLVRTEDWGSGCCGKEAETDETGLSTYYSYDGLLNVDFEESRFGTNTVITVYTYDVNGNRTSEIRTSGELSTIVTSNRYDMADRLVWSADQAGVETRYLYFDGDRSNVTIRAGLTNAAIMYLDGRVKYTAENGVRKKTYVYGVNADGSCWRKVYTGSAGKNSVAWEKTTENLLGDIVRMERTDFGGVVVSDERFYDGGGRLVRSTHTGEVDTLFKYGRLGELISTASDINGNGAIDLVGPDRVNELHMWYEKKEGDWWLFACQIFYPEADSSVPMTNGVGRIRLSGLGGVRSVTVGGKDYSADLVGEMLVMDVRGNVSTRLDLLNREAGLRIDLSSVPGSVQTNASISVSRKLTEACSSSGGVTHFGYDALGRRVIEANLASDVQPDAVGSVAALELALAGSRGRNICQFKGYNAKGQVEWISDATSNNVWFAYDGFGRRYAVIRALDRSANLTGAQLADRDIVFGLACNPEFSVGYIQYSPEGNVLATWGDSYPVAYEYDEQGRMIAMATTRDPALAAINPTSILPSGVSLAAYGLRPDAAFDVTRWLYDEASGLLTNKICADGSRSTYCYTVGGRLTLRFWARGVKTEYTYDTMGSLTNVSYGDGTPNAVFLYDRLGRVVEARTLLPRTGEAISSVTYGYSGFDLLTEIQNGVVITRGQDTLGRSTGFNVDSAMKVGYGYDALGRFSAVTSTIGTAVSGFEYSYLEGTHHVSGMRSSTGLVWSRAFEDRRDVVSAVTNLWKQTRVSSFDYVTDALGRRVTRTDTIGVSDAIDNRFVYNKNCEVTNAVMGAYSYGYEHDPIGNRVSSYRQSLGVRVATRDYVVNRLNQYVSVTNAENDVRYSAYDADGNLLTNGLWSFSWDGENRLVAAYSNDVLLVTNVYDHMNRRIMKTSLAGGRTHRYLYDGWNLIRERIISGNNGELAGDDTYFIWGLDLSDTVQGAGGVGGLLLSATRNFDTFHMQVPCYDAMGNIIQYLDENGTTLVKFAYDAFGNLVGENNISGVCLPHRFSTKYWDVETSLYYYGYRYYYPEFGRWISRDPVGTALEPVLYVFAANQPTVGIDALGLWTQDPSWPEKVGDCSIVYKPGALGGGGGETVPVGAPAGVYEGNALTLSTAISVTQNIPDGNGGMVAECSATPKKDCVITIIMADSPGPTGKLFGMKSASVYDHEMKHAKCAADALADYKRDINGGVCSKCIRQSDDCLSKAKNWAKAVFDNAAVGQQKCSAELDKTENQSRIDAYQNEYRRAVRAKNKSESERILRVLSELYARSQGFDGLIAAETQAMETLNTAINDAQKDFTSAGCGVGKR